MILWLQERKRREVWYRECIPARLDERERRLGQRRQVRLRQLVADELPKPLHACLHILVRGLADGGRGRRLRHLAEVKAHEGVGATRIHLEKKAAECGSMGGVRACRKQTHVPPLTKQAQQRFAATECERDAAACDAYRRLRALNEHEGGAA